MMKTFSTIRHYITGVLLIVLSVSSACVNAKNYPGGLTYLEIVKIPISDEAGRVAKFESYDTETQIDVYLFAMCCVEPSDAAFLGYVERNGEAKTINIAKRIAVTKREGDKVNLIRLLVHIDRECKCVAKNRQIMKMLLDSASKVSDDDYDVIKLYKQEYHDYLTELIEIRDVTGN